MVEFLEHFVNDHWSRQIRGLLGLKLFCGKTVVINASFRAGFQSIGI